MQIRTANAMTDTMAEEDYRGMWEEIRQERSLRGAAKYIGMAVQASVYRDLFPALVSHAAWDKYDKDPAQLTRRMKNELRVASGEVPLPPTIEESMEDVDGNATVAALGAPTGERLDFVLLGHHADPKLVGLTTERRRAQRVRAKAARPTASAEQDNRRTRLGVRWRDVIEAGLRSLEGADVGGNQQ